MPGKVHPKSPSMSRNDSILSVSSLPLWLSSWTTSFNCLRYAEHEQTHHSYDQIATITRVLAHTYTHNRPNDVSPREKKRNLLFDPAAGSIRHGWLLRFCYELLRYTHCLFAECICLERFIFHFLSLLFLRLVRCCCCWDRFYCHDPRATASQYEERLDIYRSPSSCSAPV